MKVYKYPTEEELKELLKRPVRDASQLNATVASVLADIKAQGDVAVRIYEEKFDHVQLQELAVTESEMQEAEHLVDNDLKMALEQAHHNIEKFHAAQKFRSEHVRVTEGVECWQKSVPRGSPRSHRSPADPVSSPLQKPAYNVPHGSH